jgi:3-methyladenine DNA glycosylase AlkD
MQYLQPLISAFKLSANPEKALWMKNYMKGQFSYFGLESKQRREIQRSFFNENTYPSAIDLFPVVFQLWEQAEREFQYCAIDLLQKFSKKYQKADIHSIEKLLLSKSWWDTVDGLAAWTCGSYFKLFPEQIRPVTSKWMKSGNFWLQRTCLLFQLKYKADADTELLESFIADLHHEKEFFIRKAIGWVLREYSKTNAAWVREYIQKQSMSALSYREASKYL